MASNKEYLEYILGQLYELEEITYRTMMGEFILYYRGKIVGGIYDDRLLVKPVKSAVRYMPTAPYELPYDGAKRMLLVEEVDNKKFLTGLFDAMYAELPASKQKRGEIDIVLADELDTSVSTLHDESVSESASDDLNFKNKEHSCSSEITSIE